MKKVLLVICIALVAASCGSDKKEKNKAGSFVKKEVKGKQAVKTTKTETKKEAPSNEASSNEASSNEAVIVLSSNDQMQYDKHELKVKAGQKVTLTLKHTGKMSKTVMGHNFVLLKKGTDIAEFAGRAMTAAATEYVPKGDKAVIVNTKIIGGGESVTITFDAPEKGTYDYICSFPGHYVMMKGKFIVE